MALNNNILPIILDGTGTEVPPLIVTNLFKGYYITGTVVATGNYALVPTGTPQFGTTYTFYYNAALDITTNGTTFQIFGTALTQAQLLKTWKFECFYTGSGWDTQLFMDFSETAIVSAANLTDLSVTTAKINNLAVTSGKLATDSVITVKIQDGAVTTPKLADDAVTTIKILDGNVTTNKLANNAVTNAKLAQMASNTVKANITGGLANPTDVPISTIITGYGWSLTGNSGTIAGTNFLGTTDVIDLVFKANNTESGRIDVTQFNTSFGYGAFNTTHSGGYNTVFGSTSLIALSSGVSNTAIGSASLQDLTSGNENIGLGKAAATQLVSGDNNIAVGSLAGNTIVTGSDNVTIGYNADVNSASALNRIALGSGAIATADYQFALPDDVAAWKIRGNSFTLPSADGIANQVLKTNGSGVLSFGTVLDSGLYTPTLTNGTNMAGSTAYQCQWSRVGNTVTVSGKLSIDPTSTGATELGISLPVASNFGNDYECGGTANFIAIAGESAGILADATNNRASLQYIAVDTANKVLAFSFTYSVL